MYAILRDSDGLSRQIGVGLEGTPEAVQAFVRRAEGSGRAIGVGFVVRVGRDVSTIELRGGGALPEGLAPLIPGEEVALRSDGGRTLWPAAVPVEHSDLEAAQRAALAAALPMAHLLGEIGTASGGDPVETGG